MVCGMFGKLPSKRDFVSYNMPRPFLDHFENWQQSAVAASQMALGSRWQDVFLTMPIWRFWLGSSVYGQTATGAMMPSVDGIGRYFPLSVCACQMEAGRIVCPPSADLDAWHDTCDAFLLRMLEDTLEDEPSALLATLPFAPFGNAARLAPTGQNVFAWSTDDGSLVEPFQALKEMNDAALHNDRCYWWTTGGTNHKAHLVMFKGRPSAGFLESLMTGVFS